MQTVFPSTEAEGNKNVRHVSGQDEIPAVTFSAHPNTLQRILLTCRAVDISDRLL